MDVKTIVIEGLIRRGYEGLYNIDGECSCALADLAPCDGLVTTCEAGVLGSCDCGQGCDFHIVERPGESEG